MTVQQQWQSSRVGRTDPSHIQACARVVWISVALHDVTLTCHICQVSSWSALQTPSAGSTKWGVGGVYKEKVHELVRQGGHLIYVSHYHQTYKYHSCVSDYPLSLQQLQSATQSLSQLAFRLGTTTNDLRHGVDFCKHYEFTAFNPSSATLCCYITFLTHHFTLTRRVRNYVSGICVLHMELGLKVQELHSSPVSSVLKAADLTMRVQPRWWLPILPGLLHQLCSLLDSLRPLALAMKVCMSFGWFSMLWQRNLAPWTMDKFDPSRQICWGDVLLSLLGILIIVCR